MSVKQAFYLAGIVGNPKNDTVARLNSLRFLKYDYSHHLPETQAQLLPKILIALQDKKAAIRLKALDVLVENHDNDAKLLATIFEAIKKDAHLFNLPLFISLASNLPQEKLREEAALAQRFGQLHFVVDALSYAQKLDAISCLGGGIFNKDTELKLVEDIFNSIKEKIVADHLFELPFAVLSKILSDSSLSAELRSSAATEISYVASRHQNFRDEAILTLGAFKNEEGRVGVFCKLGIGKLAKAAGEAALTET